MSNYSDYQVAKLSQNPKVFAVNNNELVLELKFKQYLYDEWIKNPSRQTIIALLEANGITLDMVGKYYVGNLQKKFQQGKPKAFRRNLRKKMPPQCTKKEDLSAHNSLNGDPTTWDNYTRTGKFLISNGILELSNDFLQDIFLGYPSTSVTQALVNEGFNPGEIGDDLIRRTELLLSQYIKLGTSPSETRRDGAAISVQVYRELQCNPYVKIASSKEIILDSSIYRLSVVLQEDSIDTILDIFMIPHRIFTLSEKKSIKKTIHDCAFRNSAASDYGITMYHMYVFQKRLIILQEKVDKGFDRIRSTLPGMTPYQKKLLCQWISRLPPDPGHVYNKSAILAKIGMSRTLYYLYINSIDFGMSEIKRNKQDDKDIEAIKKVIDYKGFKKGSRQVYMLLPRLTGKSFSISKIRRLMKKYGLESGIRKHSRSRKAARERDAEYTKPNLLKRMFRLHHPNEVRVTDVTYLDYGDDMRAYGSALMDPVTSRLIAFVVSEHNDLELALETIRQSDNHPCIDGGIFHSDQGILYKTEDFQKEVLDRGFNQSMSKKGNCWDNATQESFFGHFKDECDYSSCKNLNELKKMVAEYAHYYNNERGMWEKKRMTPIEYEEYLLSLSPEEFGEYLKAEKKKYDGMKKKAAELAKQHAKTLGV